MSLFNQIQLYLNLFHKRFISKKKYYSFSGVDIVIENIFRNKKIDYVMSSITGLNGLKPTMNIIKYCKIIAIANKESIICAWDLIKKELKRHNTEFVPVDSEHFSIWSLIKKTDHKMISKIYLTASGGPFFNKSKSKIAMLKFLM